MLSPSQVKDSELKLLATSLPFIVQKGRADTTIKKYKAGWQGWVEWCAHKEEVKPRPANPFYVALYLNYVYFVKSTKCAITAAFYGIRWGHHLVGLESPTDNPLVKLTF